MKLKMREKTVKIGKKQIDKSCNKGVREGVNREGGEKRKKNRALRDGARKEKEVTAGRCEENCKKRRSNMIREITDV